MLATCSVYIAAEDSRDTTRVKHSPIVILEVLSESTETLDRGEKWQSDQTVARLE